jgi:hypothetical protein
MYLVKLLDLMGISEQADVGQHVKEGLVLGVVANQNRERFVRQGLALVPTSTPQACSIHVFNTW